MDIGQATVPAQSNGRAHVWRALLAVAIVVAAAGALVPALWLASFILVASHHVNPLHAGWRAWPLAALAWYDGYLPREGRRLAVAALFGVVLALGAPAVGVYALVDRSGQRRLYGSARFADEADIRRAGLL
jgi:hypothetical protein